MRIEEVDYFPYRTGEARKHNFVSIPKPLIFDEEFKRLNCESKILYSLFLDRLSLSDLNREAFSDKTGRLYIVYTIEQVMNDMQCSKPSAVKMMKQLSDIGLIYKQRQGQGKPTLIFVNDFSRKCDKVNSTSKKNELQEVRNMNSSNTNNNKTDISNTDNNGAIKNDCTIEKEKNNNGSFSKNENELCSFPMIKDFICWYRDLYREKLGKEHPRLKKEQIQRIYETLNSFCDFHSIDSEYLEAMAISFFRHVKDTDFNLNHFATDGILEMRLYDTFL